MARASAGDRNQWLARHTALVGKEAHVGASSVILKHEKRSPGRRYQGVTVRVIG